MVINVNLGKEMVDEVTVVYRSIEKMKADGFSIPFDPIKHDPLPK